LDALAKQLGGYDLTIIGANGISPDSGLTTHRNREVAGKMTAFSNGKKRIIVCDDSKLGIVLDQPIAKFDEDILMISNSNPVLAELQNKYPEHIILV
jgi:DeoR/GlpR family transcriptional regulator of sugar metabolism